MLRASTGAWSGSLPLTYSYGWQRCSPACSDIAGATGSSYKLRRADTDARMYVVVTAVNSAGSATARSVETGRVAPSVAQIKAALRAALTPKGKAARIGAILNAGGYPTRFAALSAGDLRVAWYLAPVAARLARRLVVR